MNLSGEKRILSKRRIGRFSDLILCRRAWCRVADDLIAAMKLLEPQIQQYWQKANAQLLDRKRGDELLPFGLAGVHMMLAGFAIENLCKGSLVARLSAEEQSHVKAGVLPKSMKTHDVLALVERVGMTISETEKYLLKRIDAAVWRGRYPIPTFHEKIQPFAQFASDVRRTRALLQRLRTHVSAGTDPTVG